MELFVFDYLESQYFWTTVAFLILLGVMWRYVVPAVLAALDARALKITQDLEGAEKNRKDAEAVLAEYQAQLAQARKEAAEVVSRARAEAEAIVSERIRQVEADLSRRTEDARKSIAAAREEALVGVRGDVVDMVIKISEKLLGSSVDSKAAAKLTDDALKTLETRH